MILASKCKQSTSLTTQSFAMSDYMEVLNRVAAKAALERVW